jgi:heterodisulfide reductase subunit C
MRFPQKTAGRNEKEELMSITQKDAKDCYQCMKCSSGCPYINEMDYKPHQIIFMIKLGLYDKVLQSKSLWVCASCMACSSRCPQDIEPAKIFEGLRAMILREKDQSRARLTHKRGVPRQALIATMRKFRR